MGNTEISKRLINIIIQRETENINYKTLNLKAREYIPNRIIDQEEYDSIVDYDSIVKVSRGLFGNTPLELGIVDKVTDWFPRKEILTMDSRADIVSNTMLSYILRDFVYKVMEKHRIEYISEQYYFAVLTIFSFLLNGESKSRIFKSKEVYHHTFTRLRQFSKLGYDVPVDRLIQKANSTGDCRRIVKVSRLIASLKEKYKNSSEDKFNLLYDSKLPIRKITTIVENTDFDTMPTNWLQALLQIDPSSNAW